MSFFRIFLLLVGAFVGATGPARAERLFVSEWGRADLCAHFYAAMGEKFEVAETWTGPRVSIPALPGTAKFFDDFSELRVGSYNVLNLQSSVGRYEWKNGEFERVLNPQMKSDSARAALAAEIRGQNPDVLLLQEVEGLSSLVQFNRKYLDAAYRPILLRGNDTRGIEVAFLVKRDLPFDLEVYSHAELEGFNPRQGRTEPIFSRDAPVVLFRRPGADGRERPLLAVIGTHLKSQRNAPSDPGSAIKRAEQVEIKRQIVDALEERYPGLPVLMGGDFNGDLRSATDFRELWELGFKDSLNLVKRPIPRKDRVTLTYHPHKSPEAKRRPPSVRQQTDAILLNGAAARLGLVKEALIVPHVDEAGVPRAIPRTIEDRNLNPSDHFMVFSVIDFTKVRERWDSAR